MTVKVCTYNLRCDVKGDGINAFSNRKDFVAQAFPKYEADIIGFQEVQPHMRDWLEESLPGYTVIGTGRNADYTGEHTVIAYRPSQFRLMALDTFWLSDTPRVPGSRFATDQSICPRICTAAVLMSLADNRVVRVYNTHLDHKGTLAQAQGMTLILSRIAADDALYPDTPVILTGDFNIRPENPINAGIAAFVSCGKRMADATADIPVSFHAYNPAEKHVKIDYIYTTAACDSSRTVALTDTENGVYLSDHYPLMAEVEL